LIVRRPLESPPEDNVYTFVRNEPVSRHDSVGLVDSITGYFRSCAQFPTAQSRCKCYCAPITTGPEDSSACENGCMTCEKLATGAAKNQPDPMSLCLCFCNARNKKNKTCQDCQKLCSSVIPQKQQDGSSAE
jgi:hypothetical protein